MPEHTPAPTPARSLYGFFMYLFSKTILVLYCIWAFAPDHFLHYVNIYYYPQKFWSIAIPIQCLVALTMFAFCIYPSINLILTANIDNPITMCDTFSQYIHETSMNNCALSDTCICKDLKKCSKNIHTSHHKELEDKTVPQLYDLNIRFVCKKLYLNRCR